MDYKILKCFELQVLRNLYTVTTQKVVQYPC